ncbi:MAG TPA: dienelactone hydrolase family protein [Terrimesophilobacter sp.]|nr:dienelactone hydrolase family protein [Terrimesophilobacter sp.]HRQ00039.1 dienelactone hydrolase family protein [Terrimesophilobacter sp.]
MTIDADAVLWSAPEAERADRPLLVLLHGVGSHEGDLFGLTPHLPTEPVIASLRAPLRYGGGYAWFPMPEEAADADRWQAARDSVAGVLEWLDAQNFSSVGLLGFSQGAAMSFDLLRAAPARFSYAVPLSGFVIPEPHDGDAELARLRPPVFWGRGDADPLFTEERLAHTHEWVPQHTTATVRVYPGLGHSVSEQEIGDIAAFIQAQLG